tara:strand:- start:343 stop:849 length:507 start_codon:yes stop_codon:yes gene_type:complete
MNLLDDLDRIWEGTGIPLCWDELVVLDWYTSGHYLVPICVEFEHVLSWHEVRVRIWNAIEALSNEDGSPHTWLSDPRNASSYKAYPTFNLYLTADEATYFFNWLPPSHIWATGRDVGFSLKSKLHKYLTHSHIDAIVEPVVGGKSNDNSDEAQDNPTNSPEDGTYSCG